MPTYQYACTACDEQLEVRQSFTDDPLTECPACAGPLRKVFNAVGVVFKGSGFYKTDSRTKSEPSESSAAASDKASSASSSSASSSDSSSDSSSPKTEGATSAA